MLAGAAIIILFLFSEIQDISSTLKYLFKGPDIVDLNSTNISNIKENDWIEITGAETQYFIINYTVETETVKKFQSSNTISDAKYRYSVMMPQDDPMVKSWDAVRDIAAEISHINPDMVNDQYSGEGAKYLALVLKLNDYIQRFSSKKPKHYAIIRKYIKTDTYNKYPDGFRLNIPDDMNFQFLNTDIKQSVKNGIERAIDINRSFNINSKIRGIVEKIPEDVSKQYSKWLGKEPHFSIKADETPEWRKIVTVPLLFLLLCFVLRIMFKIFNGQGKF